MTSHAHSHLITELTAAWNNHDLSRALPLYAPDYEGLDIACQQPDRGRDGVQASLRRYWHAFPDMNFTVKGVIAQGDDLAVQWSAAGTHQGVLMHIPATGRRVQVQGVSILTLRDGVIWRGRFIWDVAGMLRGMGLLPDL
jgi:steroid delta-isomerase-like uncharacterized protein